MLRIIYIAAVAMAIVLGISCKKDNSDLPKDNNQSVTPENPVANLKKIGETYVYATAAKAIIYADKDFVVGYNNVYVMFYDSVDNTLLSDGHCRLSTLMDMGSMKHGSPVEDPDNATPEKGLYKGAAVFQMASGMMGTWKLTISYHNHKIDKEGTGELPITVHSTSNTTIKTIVTSDSTTVMISLVKPTNAKVGINNFELLLNKKETMMLFPAITDYEIEINPEMPSMGHGSPNNVNPVHQAKGRYHGKVNFTMTGLWRINIKLKKNGSTLSESTYFDVSF